MKNEQTQEAPRPDNLQRQRGRGSVARRVVVGTLSNSASQAIGVLTTLALTPFYVNEVGPAAYGVWVLVGSVTGFVYLLDLGLAAALTKFVAEHAALDDADEASRMVGAAASLYLLLGFVAATVGTGLAFVIPVLFGLSPSLTDDARVVMVLTSIAAAFSIPAAAPLSVLRGLQRFAAFNAVTTGTTLLGTLLIVSALMLGTGIVGVAWATLAGSIVSYAAALVVARRLAPDFTRIAIGRDTGRMRRLLSFSAPLAVTQVAGRMQTRVDAIVIAGALPVSRVAPYSFAQQLGTGTRMLAEQFTRVLLPMTTQLGVGRGPEAIRGLLLTSTRLTLALALAPALPLCLFGGDILDLWVGPAFAGFGILVTLLAITAVIDVVTYPVAAVLQSFELHRPLARMALGSGIANVVLSAALVVPLGLKGVALASLVATAIEIAVFVVPYAIRSLGIPPGDVSRAVLGRLIAPVGAYVVLLKATALLLPTTSLSHLFVVLALSVTGYAVMYAAFGASAYERDAYRSMVLAARRLRLPSR